jgi:YesN/AraC family two-component response regulator
MVLDFADRMSSIRQGEKPTQLTISVSNYVRRHFSEKISVEDIARELFYEPSVSFS